MVPAASIIACSPVLTQGPGPLSHKGCTQTLYLGLPEIVLSGCSLSLLEMVPEEDKAQTGTGSASEEPGWRAGASHGEELLGLHTALLQALASLRTCLRSHDGLTLWSRVKREGDTHCLGSLEDPVLNWSLSQDFIESWIYPIIPSYPWDNCSPLTHWMGLH